MRYALALALMLALRVDFAYYGWQVGVTVGRVEVVARQHGRNPIVLICFVDGQALS